MCVCVRAQSLSRVPTLCDSVDCSPPGSSVHGILQARVLEWVAMPSPGIFPIQEWNSYLLALLHWQAGTLPREPPRKPFFSSNNGYKRDFPGSLVGKTPSSQCGGAPVWFLVMELIDFTYRNWRSSMLQWRWKNLNAATKTWYSQINEYIYIYIYIYI